MEVLDHSTPDQNLDLGLSSTLFDTRFGDVFEIPEDCSKIHLVERNAVLALGLALAEDFQT